MIFLTKIITIITFFSFSYGIEGFKDSAPSESLPLELFVYDGQGSILLSWTYPEIEINKINLFMKKFDEKDFNYLASINSNQTKYLDINCDEGARYFYKMELEDINGVRYSTDIEMPPFGNCLNENKEIEFTNNIHSVNDLIFNHIGKKLKEINRNNDLLLVLRLLQQTNPQSKNNWIERFPLKILNEIKPHIPVFDDIINDPNFAENILNYGGKYRNHLYLNPESWIIKVNESVVKIRNDWEILYNQYSLATDEFDIISPLRVLSSEYSDDEHFLLRLYLFHVDKLEDSDVYILSGKEYIDLNRYKKKGLDCVNIKVPSYWDYIDLMIDDKLIQRAPLFIDKSITYTLEGDMIPKNEYISEDNGLGEIYIGSDKSSFWFNEIVWDPSEYKFMVELSGIPSIGNKYTIYYNDFLLWDVNYNSNFEDTFFDSSFTLAKDIDLPITISLSKVDDKQTTVLEYILLDTIDFAISRVPDGNKWIKSELYTLGRTNQITENPYRNNIVPDIFVLYQNYPNPFNGSTKISFNLLEDAVISLYVTDAKGRVHDKLLDNQYTNVGNYNYVWDGEDRATGIYFITLQATINEAPSAIVSRKMIYLK